MTTDHHVVGRRFMLLGAVALAAGGVLALLIRTQAAWPDVGLLSPTAYGGAFTMHGLVMIFWAVTPLLSGLATFLVPDWIGAPAPAFPRCGAAASWLHVVSALVALASFACPFGPAAAGWTGYPPLATIAPGAGPSLVLVALVLAGIATVLVSINVVVTVGWLRAPGMTWMRLPLSAWGFTLAAALNVIFVPVLAVASLLVLLDRHAATGVFAPGPGGGDPLLYQHLFWLFGHPQVYIVILPAWGVVADLLAFGARRPAAWYRGTVGALVAVSALSGLVYGHHLFVAGLSPLASAAFQVLTLAITVPATVLVVNWLRTLHGGALRPKGPGERWPRAQTIAALGFVVVFGLGGLTGIPLGAAATDMALHDSMYVVGHFHLTMAASVLIAVFASIHHWFPRITGRMLSERLGRWHVGLTVVLLLATFSGQLAAGWLGQPRRLPDPFAYAFVEPLRALNAGVSVAAFLLAGVQLLLVANIVRSLRHGPPAPPNPWDCPTLEWTLASPDATFAVPPVVRRGPHELSHPAARRALGRDWVGQAEPPQPWE